MRAYDIPMSENIGKVVENMIRLANATKEEVIADWGENICCLRAEPGCDESHVLKRFEEAQKRNNKQRCCRKGEIALLCLKYKLLTQGIKLHGELRRDIGNAAKAMGIPVEEAVEFTHDLLNDLINTVLSPKSKSQG